MLEAPGGMESFYIALEQVELFIYYYPCSIDDVWAIRLAA